MTTPPALRVAFGCPPVTASDWQTILSEYPGAPPDVAALIYLFGRPDPLVRAAAVRVHAVLERRLAAGAAPPGRVSLIVDWAASTAPQQDAPATLYCDSFISPWLTLPAPFMVYGWAVGEVVEALALAGEGVEFAAVRPDDLVAPDAIRAAAARIGARVRLREGGER